MEQQNLQLSAGVQKHKLQTLLVPVSFLILIVAFFVLVAATRAEITPASQNFFYQNFGDMLKHSENGFSSASWYDTTPLLVIRYKVTLLLQFLLIFMIGFLILTFQIFVNKKLYAWPALLSHIPFFVLLIYCYFMSPNNQISFFDLFLVEFSTLRGSICWILYPPLALSLLLYFTCDILSTVRKKKKTPAF